MFESVLCVRYVSYKNCFVYLSPLHTNLNTGAYIKVSYADKEAYFSARVIRDAVDSDSIGISPTYAKLLGIIENDLVNVTHLEQLPVVNSITIRASTKSDYEILEVLSQNVQSSLLDQVRVVATDQKMVIWIGSNLTVSVNVEHVQPISPGTLDFLTEVIIDPPYNGISQPLNIPRTEPSNNPLKEIMYKMIETNADKPEMEPYLAKTEVELCFRLLPLSVLGEKTVKIPLFCGFLKRINLPSSEFVYISPISNTDKKVVIQLCPIEDYFDITSDIFQEDKSNNLFVEDSVLSFIHADIFSRVNLTEIPPTPHITQIEVHSKKNYFSNTIEKFKQFLADSSKPLVLNANFPVKMDNFYVSLKFLPNLSEFCIVDEDFLRNCSYSLFDDPVMPLEALEKVEQKRGFCEELSCFGEVSRFVEEVLFKVGRFGAENIIVVGKPGMGKSSTLSHISTKLKSYPYFIKTELVQCKKIKGKTVDSLHKFFGDVFNKLIYCQPSMLILDDLEVLCEFCEGEETPNSVYSNRVSEMLHSLFSTIQKRNQIGILASTKSVSNLNRHIYRSRGNHMFKNIISMKDLDKDDRICLLKFFFEQHPVDSIDYEELSIQTDGFVIQDINDFYEKTLFEAYKGLNENDKVIIYPGHIDEALKKSCALSLQNVKFHSTGSKSFDDIGGLHNVKNILVESLLWPVKYGSIFANSPLRLQSGILLYGPPGTGKTLLAGAAAKQCSLRLISIKGPELLSKYIGASEQAVRDVFEKAQRAKPCILFFDEFDSLAPRRGHDNTGVTDRVVNQLLTQLDGVEALTGVCVLAATSRPDLLDPALLRPGRLDKQLMCPMPDHSDRLGILQTLSNKLQLSEDVNLDEIALKTEGYSGADLQSVLYTAQMSTMKDLMNMDNVELQMSKVTHTMLLGALAKTRPSLTKTERLKYDRIYKKFQGGKLEDFQTGSKVTLA